MKQLALNSLGCSLWLAMIFVFIATTSDAQVVIPLMGGDPGQGFAPLPVDVGGVALGGGPTFAIQNVTFNAGAVSSVAGAYIGDYSYEGNYGFGETTNDLNLAAMLENFTFVYVPDNMPWDGTAGLPHATYQFTGLTAGQTYQVDIFTVADANPRYTLTQVVGATTLSTNVLTGLSPQDVQYTITPDASGNITINYGFGGFDESYSGNSGLVSGIAITTQPSQPSQFPAPTVIPLTGGNPGQGFAPLLIDAGGVDLGGGPTLTVQGVTFNSGAATAVAGDDIGNFSYAGNYGFSNTTNDTNMATMLESFTFAYVPGNVLWDGTAGSPHATYQFTGLAAGQTYQVDIFTVADANPRYTLTQVVGGVALSTNVLTELSPQDVKYTMTPDTNGNITINYGFGGFYETYSGNSGLVSGIALTANPPAPTVTALTGGDPGQGFAPLPIDIAGVDLGGGPTLTIQGVTFNTGASSAADGGYIGNYSYTGNYGFGETINDANMAAMLESFNFTYVANNAPWDGTAGSPHATYQVAGLTAGQFYQVDLFTVADSNPRYTLTQVAGVTTISTNVLTGLSPQDVKFIMAPDANGNITINYGFGGYAGTNNGNSGLLSGIAVTTQTGPASIPVLSEESDPDGATLQMNPGTLKLQVFSPGVVRVAYSPSNSIPPWSNSFSVITPPATNDWPLTTTSNYVQLATGLLDVQVNLTSGAVGFYATNGSLLLQEIPYGGKSLTAATLPTGGSTLKCQQTFLVSPGEAFYGLGQHQSGIMNYANSSVHLQQMNPGESAMPVLVSSHGYGLLWDNPSITDVSFNNQQSWVSQAGNGINYYFMYGPQPDAIVAGYRGLTGAAPMFARWAWGYWQSKNAYTSQAQLLSVENQYRTSNIPIDCLVQDWMYWSPNPWGSDQFNSQNYPNVAQLMQTLHSNNVHMVISKWPRFDIGNYTNYLQLSNATALYSETFTADGSGALCQFYDSFNPTGRALYWQQISNDLFSLGIDGWWLDGSEPELTGNWGEYANYKTAAGSGALVYNAYPLMHTAALYQGQRGSTSSKRVFTLTRSAYAGQQRNAAVTWSGDIASTWPSFATQIPAGLNFSISGIPYWNTDIGGYQDDNGLGDPTSPAYDELFTRWFQYGAFCPMFRVHGQNFGKEMWQFPTNTEAILINFDQLRYHLLPYIYSVSWMVTTNAYTMMRPLIMDFGQDTNVYGITDQYMFGPAIMVNPVTQAGATNWNVYLPAGATWYDFWTGLTYAGGQTIDASAPINVMPLYVRAGSIIPYGPSIQYTTQSADPIELRVYRGASGSFTLYEDENDNYDYETGTYATIPISWNDSSQTLTIGQRQGSFPGMLTNRTFNIVWVGSGQGVGVPSTPTPNAIVQYQGEAVQISAGSSNAPSVSLSISSASLGQGVTLQWPENSNSNSPLPTNLYYAPNFTPPVVWTPVTNSPLLSNGQWMANLPISNGQRYFRLQQ